MSEAISETVTEQDIYAPFRARLEELRMKAQGAQFEYESKTGNAAARSYVHSLRGEKGKIEAARKAAKEAVLVRGRAIDDGAKVIVSEIDELIAVHTRHLEAIEAREKARVDRLREALARVGGWTVECAGQWQTLAQERFDEIAEGIGRARTFDWQEFANEAGAAIGDAASALAKALTDRQEYDDQQAELAKLRAERDAREQAERERVAAEERAARDKRIADEAAARAEAAEREKAAAAQRARDAEAQRQIDQANQRAAEAERAAKAEQDRIAREETARQAEAKRIADAQARRDADEAHRTATKAGAVAVLVQSGLPQKHAAMAVELIAAGAVPSVRITY